MQFMSIVCKRKLVKIVILGGKWIMLLVKYAYIELLYSLWYFTDHFIFTFS